MPPSMQAAFDACGDLQKIIPGREPSGGAMSPLAHTTRDDQFYKPF
jgi:hypothetical protein